MENECLFRLAVITLVLPLKAPCMHDHKLNHIPTQVEAALWLNIGPTSNDLHDIFRAIYW